MVTKKNMNKSDLWIKNLPNNDLEKTIDDFILKFIPLKCLSLTELRRQLPSNWNVAMYKF